MSNTNDFIIENGVLKKYVGSGGNVVIPEGVFEIGYQAFRCRRLTSVTIPDSVTKIDYYAFYWCPELSSVTFGKGVTEICANAFIGTSKLNSIILPDIETFREDTLGTIWGYFSVKNREMLLMTFIKKYPEFVKKNDFMGRKIKANKKMLIELSVKNNDAQILEVLFSLYKKISLEDIDEYIKQSVSAASVTAFLLDYKTNNYSVESRGKFENDKFEKELGFKTKTIADWKKMFKFKNREGEIIIEKYIGDGTIVTVPDTIGKAKVVAIAPDAFKDCKEVSAIDIPDSIDSMVDVELEGTAFFENPDNWEDGALYAGKHLISMKTDKQGEYVVKPETKSISNHAFSDCSELTSVTLPEGIAIISNSLFNGCKKLESVNIPDSVTEIADLAFYGCQSLADVNIPDGVTRIGDYAFRHCESLKSINIPEGIYDIGAYAFERCTSLVAVAMPSCIDELGECAFCNCTSLEAITIPCGFEKIGESTFFNCQNLESVIIPDGIDIIGEKAFEHCDKLSSVVIPESVSKIRGRAFAVCKNLASVTICSEETELAKTVFASCKKVTIKCPEDSLAEEFAEENNIPFIAE